MGANFQEKPEFPPFPFFPCYHFTHTRQGCRKAKEWGQQPPRTRNPTTYTSEQPHGHQTGTLRFREWRLPDLGKFAAFRLPALGNHRTVSAATLRKVCDDVLPRTAAELPLPGRPYWLAVILTPQVLNSSSTEPAQRAKVGVFLGVFLTLTA